MSAITILIGGGVELIAAILAAIVYEKTRPKLTSFWQQYDD